MKCTVLFWMTKRGRIYKARFWKFSVETRLKVQVSPGSKKSEIEGFDPWKNALIVKVRSPPEGGKANRELIELLSEFFSAEVEIVSGLKSRKKTVVVRGLSKEDVYDRAKKA